MYDSEDFLNGFLFLIGIHSLSNKLLKTLSYQRQLENLGAQRAGLEDILKEMKRKVRNIYIFHPQHICKMLILWANIGWIHGSSFFQNHLMEVLI